MVKYESQKCRIKDILFDSYPPRVSLLRVSDTTTIVPYSFLSSTNNLQKQQSHEPPRYTHDTLKHDPFYAKSFDVKSSMMEHKIRIGLSVILSIIDFSSFILNITLDNRNNRNSETAAIAITLLVFYLIFLIIHISKFRNSQLVKQSDNVNMDNILDIKELRINSMSTINSHDNVKRQITKSAVNDGGIQML